MVAPFSFRPLVSSDIPTLHEWLGRPHVGEWWGPAPSLAEVEADYLPMTEPGAGTRGYIALLDGREIGFIQCYVVLGSEDGWWEDETDPGARGIDQFLADAEDLGKGLGSAIVRAFVDGLFRDPAVTKVQVDPSPDNVRAIRSYRRAGFLPLGEVITPDGPALLMIRRNFLNVSLEAFTILWESGHCSSRPPRGLTGGQTALPRRSPTRKTFESFSSPEQPYEYVNFMS